VAHPVQTVQAVSGASLNSGILESFCDGMRVINRLSTKSFAAFWVSLLFAE
jgi:hypothetical protein